MARLTSKQMEFRGWAWTLLPLPFFMWDGEKNKPKPMTPLPKGVSASVTPGIGRVQLIQLRLVQKFKVVPLCISVQV